MPAAQGDAYATDVEEDDVDECHKNDFLPKDVAGILEVHNNDECEVASDLSAIQSKENKPTQKKKRKNAEAVLWKTKSSLKKIPEANVLHLADSHPHLALLGPVALLPLLFNEDIYSLIACETERYASQRNEVIYLILQEIRAFVGIFLLIGYNCRPRQRLYWSKDDDINCPLISSSMSSKRFEDIKKLILFNKKRLEPKSFHFCLESVDCKNINYFFALANQWLLMNKIKVVYGISNVIVRFCHITVVH